MNRFRVILWLLFGIAFNSVYAINSSAKAVRAGVHPGGKFINHSEWIPSGKDWDFVENKGQVNDNETRFYGHQGGAYLYCKPGLVSFVFTKVEKEPEQISEATGSLVETQCLRLNRASAIPQSPLSKDTFNASLQRKITTNRADLILLNSNPCAEILASDQQEYYENFYLANTPEQGITHIHTYKTIIYKNIYPFIDLVLHSREEGMKYEFVVYPGGKVSNIQVQWNGLEGIKKLKDSGIAYSLACADDPSGRTKGALTESAPYTYQCASNVRAGFAPAPSAKIQNIPSHFILKNNIIGFKTDKYDKTRPLTIDPTLIWGTYFGGSEEDYGSGVATDSAGNVYIGGSTSSVSDIATSGAYQTFYTGGGGSNNFLYPHSNAYLAKFSSNGKIQWATYYGDSSSSSGIAVDGTGNTYITGSTMGKSGIATKGAYQSSYKGFYASEQTGDAFLAKFNGQGLREWGTYFGGNGEEYTAGNGIATDLQGNVYFTGIAEGSSGIATTGAYQTSGGAFLAKFNAVGVLQWGTYYGGDLTTPHSVAADHSGNIYIAGNTIDSMGIATSGAFQATSGGTNIGAGDGFFAKFNNTGQMQWSSYFGTQITVVTGITTDASGCLYMTGYTNNSNMATAGAYQTSNGSNGGITAFLAKFSPSCKEYWATFFGGPIQTQGRGVATDGFGNIYISGVTFSTSGIATNGAYQQFPSKLTYNQTVAPFLARFSSAGSRLWATYFGGDSDDAQFYGLWADISGNVYMTPGSFISHSGFATSGAYQTSYAGNGDAFLAKFNFSSDTDAGIIAVPAPNGILCPGKQTITVQLHNFGNDELNSAIIGFSVNGKAQPYYKWTGNLSSDSSVFITLNSTLFTVGQDTIKSWISNINGLSASSLPWRDTSINVLTAAYPVANVGQSTYSVCTGTHIKIGANAQPSYVYAWSSVPVGFSSTLADPVVNPTANTVYNLMVTDTLTGCTNTNSANVSVSILQAPVVNAGSNQSICMGVSAQIGSSAQSGDMYSWTSNPVGFVSTMANPVVTPVQTTSYSLTVTNTNGCTNFDSVTITVNPRPTIIVATPQNICSQTAIQLGGSSTPGNIYQWTSKPVGFSSSISNPIDSPALTTTYYLKETISATGCADSDSVKITVAPRPNAAFDVKNIGGFEYQFTVNNPNYPSLQYQWDFNDPVSGKAGTVSGYNVSHVYAQNGNYEAVLTIALPGYCTETDSDLIVVDESFSLNIFPNPFNLQTNIQYLLTSPGHVKITMTDDIGRNIGMLLDRQLNQGEYNTVFDGAAWKTRPGMYFIIFQLDDKVIVKKTVQIDSIYY